MGGRGIRMNYGGESCRVCMRRVSLCYTPDNSFFLRVEKCDPIFKHKLNQQIERMYGIQVPAGVRDQTEHWPRNALYNYCQCKNPRRRDFSLRDSTESEAEKSI